MLHAANREEDLHDDPDCCENDDDVHDKQQPVAFLEERTQLDEGSPQGHHCQEEQRDKNWPRWSAQVHQNQQQDGQRQACHELVRGTEQRPNGHAARTVGALGESQTKGDQHGDTRC